MRGFLAAILSIALMDCAAAQMITAQQSVDLELVLLADASGSIDEAEIRFQRAGYAAAISHPAVLAAIAGGGFHQRIAVTYVEWGDADHQAVVVPWTVIDGPDSAAAFGQDLMSAPRQAFGRNAIGSAIAIGQALIDGNDIAGVRKVIDLSADSAYSWGGVPLPVARQSAIDAGMTINGLAILCRERDCGGRPADYDVEAAFADHIIGGAGAFVVTVDGRGRFAEAVRKKLLLEIAAGDFGPGDESSSSY